MKAGSFNIKDYLERLNEEAEVKASAASSIGLIIPEENKKNFNWLKSEYQKGKTEVKVEIKLGDSKFNTGMNLQTDLKSVKDFKPGMFGAVKTGDNEGAKKDEECDENTDKKTDSPVKKLEATKKSGTTVKSAEVKDKDGKKVNEDIKIIKTSSKSDHTDLLEYFKQLPMTRTPSVEEDLFYCKKIKSDLQLEGYLDKLPIVEFKNYEDLLTEWSSNSNMNSFFIARVSEDLGATFLVDSQGKNHAKYIAELK